jgi:apolipoprotein N-acyltransferase
MKAGRIVSLLGFMTVILAIPATYILGFFREGYDPLRMTISELGENGAPTAFAAAIIFAAVGLCETLFAAALAMRFKFKAAALLGSIFMAINGISDYIGSAIFPIDSGGLFESATGKMHYLVSVVGMSVMIFPAFFYARVLKNEHMYKQSKNSMLLALAISVAALLFIAAFFTETLVGSAQRIIDLAYFGWILYISIALYSETSHSEEISA